ncbi:hypothetical protein [Nocardia sp. CDC160]|uniref:hypothetical protein n=1 Tax=Nocardia sp. CDC160 TaxID=3112166 RepID=UPI002DBA396A|nr:hypothetical protein [Nocardia sp. CDC160]MEC3913445.1 hypothetical protein [Nocardia sp. CDC160]
MSEQVGSAAVPAPAGRSVEFWGYCMWGLAGLAIAVSELASVFRLASWPTISNTIGHLETQHDWVRLIVVAVIVLLAYYAVPQLTTPPAPVVQSVAGRTLTANGRVTKGDSPVTLLGAGYLVAAIGTYIFGVLFAAADRGMHPNSYLGAYVLYGLIALMWVIVPSILAMFFSRDVPFPTLFRTIGYLERRAHPVAAILLAGLVVLLIHLAFYPWPVVAN